MPVSRPKPWQAVVACLAAAPFSAPGARAQPVSHEVTTAALQSSGFGLLREYPIGGSGGWDDLTVDAAARRIYVPHAGRVEVLQADTGAKLGAVEETSGVHAVAIASEAGRGYTSNGRTNDMTVFDTKTLAVLGRIPAGKNPDAIVFEPTTKAIFCFNGRSNDVTVADVATTAVRGTVALGGKPEFAVADGKGRVYVNIEDKGTVVVLDAKTLKVAATYPLAPGTEPTGIAMDMEARRLYSACGNETMVVLDADTGKVVATAPIGKGADGAAFDPATKTAFASCGRDGQLSAVREVSPGVFAPLSPVPTRNGARTMTRDAKTGQMLLPTARFGPPPAAAPDGGAARRWPAVLPDSFTLLVVGPQPSAAGVK